MRDIIRRRFGLDPSNYPETLQEIADDYDVSRSRIQQIENRALRQLEGIAHGYVDVKEYCSGSE